MATARKRPILPPPAGYLKIDELAKATGVSEILIRSWAERGELPFIRLGDFGRSPLAFREAVIPHVLHLEELAAKRSDGRDRHKQGRPRLKGAR